MVLSLWHIMKGEDRSLQQLTDQRWLAVSGLHSSEAGV